MTILKPLLQLVSPAGARARLSVLIFHRVLPDPDPLFPDEMDARRFDALCGWLKGWFNVLPLDQAAARLQAGTLPARAACITFDDGYADNCRVAMPILLRHGLTATFFIATGFLDGGRMWNDTIIETVRNCEELTWMSPVCHPGLDPGSMPARGHGCRIESGMTKDAVNAPPRVVIAGTDPQSMSAGGHGLRVKPAMAESCHTGQRPGIHAPTVAQRQAAITTLINQIKYLPVAERVAVTEQLALEAKVQLPTDLMMTSADVKAMRRAGMQIGAHTVSHPILARLSRAEAMREIGDSKRFLEDLLGERVALFAYPNGKPGEDYSPESVDVVRSLGFDAAVSTQWGASRMGDDVLQIKRFTPWDKARWRFGVRLLRNL